MNGKDVSFGIVGLLVYVEPFLEGFYFVAACIGDTSFEELKAAESGSAWGGNLESIRFWDETSIPVVGKVVGCDWSFTYVVV